MTVLHRRNPLTLASLDLSPTGRVEDDALSFAHRHTSAFPRCPCIRVGGHAAMKSYNAFARGADLRQMTQAVVAGAVTIGALSYGRKRKTHKESGAPIDAYVMLHRPVQRAPCRARSPIGAPPRLSPVRRWSQKLSSRPGFLGRGFGGRYPPSPVPVQ